MLLLYGRRRLGKTFLLQRYFTAGVDGEEHEKPHCYFLAEHSTAATQRLTLARLLISALPSEGISAAEIAVSWNALLRYASQQARGWERAPGRFASILDEFPYLVAQTPELPSILQAWWDREAVHSPLLVVLRGEGCSQLSIQLIAAGLHPWGVVLLRSSDVGVCEEIAHVLDGVPGQQQFHGIGVPQHVRVKPHWLAVLIFEAEERGHGADYMAPLR